MPAPATLEILKGIPVLGGGQDYEATTPTGAAIIKALVNEFTDIPQMTIKSAGTGAGSTTGSCEKNLPNILRILYGDTDKYDPENSGFSAGLDIVEKIFILSTNIDDSTAETVGYVSVSYTHLTLPTNREV